MKRKVLALLVAATLWTSPGIAGQTPNSAGPRHITLREAVELALKHNHDVRLAGFSVDEKQHAKEAEKSSYFPSIHNDSILARLTDTQLIQIQAGSLGTVSGTPVPVENSIINQGGRTLTTSGTQITQPLTSLLKIRRANDIAQAEVEVSRAKAQLTSNDVALTVHEVYYAVLIAQAHRDATQARIEAAQDLETERTAQVLRLIASSGPVSNRSLAKDAGNLDEGQVSKLLARLSGLGLIANDAPRSERGAANAWSLTAAGVQLLADIAAAGDD